MLYFKKNNLAVEQTQNLEKAIRKVAIKRTSSLDFKSAVINIGTDKIFLGFEDKKNVKFTRLRTSFERILPQIIISFPRDTEEGGYKLRYSLLSTTIFIVLMVFFLLITVTAIANHYNYESILVAFIFFGAFLLSTFTEVKIVDAKIQKALLRNP